MIGAAIRQGVRRSRTGDGFHEALERLQRAQKSAKGGPAYSVFVNRPLGRLLAAASYHLGATPNQVSGVSAVSTFLGIVVLALAPPTLLVGVVVTLCLVLGYALDSADGQLARLRGGGTVLGEWLDHTVDSVKVIGLHIAVLITCYRHFDLHPAWLLVPIAFAWSSSVHFFGMILIDMLTRVRRATLGAPQPAPATSRLLVTVLKLPTDYGILCLSFAVLGAESLFFAIYAVLAAAMCAYTVLVVPKWRRDAIALDALAVEAVV